MAQPNILEYLPSFLKELREMQVHAAAEFPEISKLWTATDNAYNDQFLYTMGENGVSRWEKMLAIIPMETDSLEDRRFRIINRLNAKLPYSYRMLESHLNQMCGADGYQMSYDQNTLAIRIALTSKKQFDDVLNLVKQMVPMNIELNCDLLYNTYQALNDFTHQQLSVYTYGALRSELIS